MPDSYLGFCHKHLIQLHDIHKKLKIVSKSFTFSRQEDAHEYLRALLTKMEEKFWKKSIWTCTQNLQPQSKIFRGYMRSTCVCNNCNNHSSTRDYFLDLQLQINTNESDSVFCALQRHFIAEKITQYNCENCNLKEISEII